MSGTKSSISGLAKCCKRHDEVTITTGDFAKPKASGAQANLQRRQLPQPLRRWPH
jgi:hypothetical protein